MKKHCAIFNWKSGSGKTPQAYIATTLFHPQPLWLMTTDHAVQTVFPYTNLLYRLYLNGRGKFVFVARYAEKGARPMRWPRQEYVTEV